jgi:long-chain fatty acid transport protein
MGYRLFLILLALVVVASGAVAQNQWNITGAGARAEGMGGAFIGLADDATAIVWNPAGLGQLERTEFSLVGRWVQDTYKLEVKPTNGASTSSETNLAHFAYNFSSIAFPLHAGKVTIVPAVAYQKQIDNYYRMTSGTDKYEGDGGANTITPGIAFRLHPMFLIGGAVNIWTGNYTDTYRSGTSGNDFDGSYSGLNFTAGLLVDFEGMKKPLPFKIGATIRTPFDLKVEGDYQPLTRGIAGTKTKFSNTAEMPFMIGAGLSVRPVENLTITFDYEARLYGDSKIYETVNGQPSDTVNMSDSKSNLNQIRVGAEYLLVTTVGVFPIRAGFRTEPTLMADIDYIQGKYTDQVAGNGFTVGTGFITKTFALDVTYSRSSADQNLTASGAKGTETYSMQMVSASLVVYF